MQHFYVNFYDDNIETSVTSDPSVVERRIDWSECIHRRCLNKLVVGLDLEWCPNFMSGGQDNPIALIQLCVGHWCLIFQVLYAKHVPNCLYKFMSNPKYNFVWVGIKEDAQKLLSGYGLRITNIVEIRLLAAIKTGDRQLPRTNLEGLGVTFLGKVLEKPKVVTLSRWDERMLPFRQVEYACLSAFVCFELGRVLSASVN